MAASIGALVLQLNQLSDLTPKLLEAIEELKEVLDPQIFSPNQLQELLSLCTYDGINHAASKTGKTKERIRTVINKMEGRKTVEAFWHIFAHHPDILTEIQKQSLKVTWMKLDEFLFQLQRGKFLVSSPKCEIALYTAFMSGEGNLGLEIYKTASALREQTAQLKKSEMDKEIYLGIARHVTPVPDDDWYELVKACNTRIEELTLSKRIVSNLKRANIQTVGQLIQYSQSNIRSIRNMGTESMIQLANTLANLGISLRK